METGHKPSQILTGEGPAERSGGLFVALLESQKRLFQLGQRREIVGRENFALNDGEVDLHLVEPTGMVGSVQRNNRGPAGLQSLDALLAAVHGAIIHDPKYALGRAIGLLLHHLSHQAIEGLDSVAVSTAT